MSGFNPETYVSERAREAESVGRITHLLMTHFHFCGVEETQHFDKDDKCGVDLFLFPDMPFTELTGFPIMRAQVKSSEAGVDGFYEKGKKINGLEGHEWRQRKLVVLNGSWAQETILADFMGQTANLMGIWDDPVKLNDFVNAFDEYPRLAFRRTAAKGLLKQYREPLYDWVAGRVDRNKKKGVLYVHPEADIQVPASLVSRESTPRRLYPEALHTVKSVQDTKSR
jgi:hypothetical protein